MTSKASRLRAKRAARDSMELAPTPKRAKQGRKRMREIKDAKPADESQHAIRVRCVKAGRNPDDEAAQREMRAPWHGCIAGRSMARYVTDHTPMGPKREAETQRLWQAIQHIRRACAAYDRAIGAPPRHAQSLRIMLPVDEMHADAASPPLDVRDEAQRAADAKRVWAEVELLVGRFGMHTANITLECVLEDSYCRDATAMVLALRNVADRVVAAR